MSGTLTSHPRRPRRAAPSDAITAERQALLQAAARGDVQAIGQICDRHGAALFALARAIVEDPVRAEAVVVEVVARACADPAATATVATGSLRRELARLTYLHSSRDLPAAAPPQQPGSAEERMARLGVAARQQRAAIALVQCGDHSVDDVANLLDLPMSTVTVLLACGLRDLEAADRRPADDGLQRHASLGHRS